MFTKSSELMLIAQQVGQAETIHELSRLILPVVVVIGFFTFLSIVGFAWQRRLEREAYYRGEVNKRLVEEGKLTVDDLRAAKERDRYRSWRARREALRLAGIVVLAASLGLAGTLQLMDESGPVAVIFLPLSIGGALFVYAYALYPRYRDGDEKDPGGNGEQLQR